MFSKIKFYNLKRNFFILIITYHYFVEQDFNICYTFYFITSLVSYCAYAADKTDIDLVCLLIQQILALYMAINRYDLYLCFIFPMIFTFDVFCINDEQIQLRKRMIQLLKVNKVLNLHNRNIEYNGFSLIVGSNDESTTIVADVERAIGVDIGKTWTKKYTNTHMSG